MTKEKEIRNMLEYLCKKDICKFTQSSPGLFHVEGFFCAPNNLKLLARQNHNDFTVDFNKKTMSIYAYDESYHNGDHYNCFSLNLKWSCLLTGYESLKEYIRPLALQDFKDEEENKIAKKQLQKILKGIKSTNTDI